MNDKETKTKPHDKFVKDALSQPETIPDLLKLYLPHAITKLIDTKRIEQVKDSFVDEELQEEFSDLIFRVGLKNGSDVFVYILLEHKSFPDKWVAFQLLCYIVRFWNKILKQGVKLLPIVFPVVLYHGKRRWTVDKKFSALFDLTGDFSDLRGYVPEFEYHLCDLSEYEDEEIVGSEPLQAVLRLLKHIFQSDLKEQMYESLRLLYGSELTEERKLEYSYSMLNYLLMSKRATERDFSRAMAAAIEEKGEGKMQNFMDVWREEGIQQGLQQGLQRGREEGKQEGEARFALRQLKYRFGELNSKTEERIRSLSVEKLEELSEVLLEFQSRKDLTAWLQANARKGSKKH